MNSAQKRAVAELEAAALEVIRQHNQQTKGRVDQVPDHILKQRLAKEAGMGFWLGDEEFVVDASGITDEWLIQHITERTAKRLGMTVEELQALSPEDAHRLIVGDRGPVRQEWRYSDRGER